VLVLQGNAATKLRCGGKYYSYLIRKWFLVAMQTRCSAIAERPRCRVRYSFRQK